MKIRNRVKHDSYFYIRKEKGIERSVRKRAGGTFLGPGVKASKASGAIPFRSTINLSENPQYGAAEKVKKAAVFLKQRLFKWPRKKRTLGLAKHAKISNIYRLRSSPFCIASITDPLTKIYNRRFFMQKLEEEIERAQRTGNAFSLIMLDIDHFKSINDRFGHK